MIHKILNIRTKNYLSDLSGDNLKQQIKTIFQQNNMALAAKLVDENEFVAYDRANYITWPVPNFKRKTAYLKGIITQTATGTSINLYTKPHPLITIFPIFLLLIGIIFIIKAGLIAENRATLIFGVIVIAVGIGFYLTGILFRRRLQNNFKKYLDF